MRPEIVKLNSKSINLAAKRAAQVLKSGGIVVHPTDTCYGIAADVFNPKAIKKIYQFKGRDYQNPLFVILPSISQFKKYGRWNSLIEKTIKKYPQKMFTFIVLQKKTIPSHFNPDFKTIGIQIPKNPFSLTLLKKFRLPLAGTSANLSGTKNNYSIRSLINQLKNSRVYPDLIIDSGRLPVKKPSSVVQIKNNQINYLRK